METVQPVQSEVVARQILYNGFLSNMPHHFYIIVAPTKAQQQAIYKWYVQLHVCENRDEQAVCGTCPGCQRVLTGNYVNSTIITKKEEKKSLGVEEVSALQDIFKTTALINETRFFCIEDADLLTVQAANSLLKFLEEPIGSVIGFLFATNEQKMLPTILSRGQLLRLGKAPIAEETLVHVSRAFPDERDYKLAYYLIENNYSEDVVLKQLTEMMSIINKYATKVANGSPYIVAQTDLESFATKTKTGTLILDLLAFILLEHFKNNTFFDNLPPHVAPYMAEHGMKIFLSIYNALLLVKHHTSIGMIMTQVSLNMLNYDKKE